MKIREYYAIIIVAITAIVIINIIIAIIMNQYMSILNLKQSVVQEWKRLDKQVYLQISHISNHSMAYLYSKC